MVNRFRSLCCICSQLGRRVWLGCVDGCGVACGIRHVVVAEGSFGAMCLASMCTSDRQQCTPSPLIPAATAVAAYGLRASAQAPRPSADGVAADHWCCTGRGGVHEKRRQPYRMRLRRHGSDREAVPWYGQCVQQFDPSKLQSCERFQQPARQHRLRDSVGRRDDHVHDHLTVRFHPRSSATVRHWANHESEHQLQRRCWHDRRADQFSSGHSRYVLTADLSRQHER